MTPFRLGSPGGSPSGEKVFVIADDKLAVVGDADTPAPACAGVVVGLAVLPP